MADASILPAALSTMQRSRRSTTSTSGARELVAALVKELVRRGANFVVPVDAEPLRKADRLPICFDWLIWQTLKDNLGCARRRSWAAGDCRPAPQERGSNPASLISTCGTTCAASPLVKIENAAHWNMASKRMEAQARFGDILVALGGIGGGALSRQPVP